MNLPILSLITFTPLVGALALVVVITLTALFVSGAIRW